MAEPTSLLRPINRLPLQKTLIFVFFALVLPLFPSQKPDSVTNRTILDKIWELLQLLFIGIVISYGLFSRRNTEMVLDKEFVGSKSDNPSSYVSQFIPGLNEREEDEEEESKVQQQIWSNQFDISKPSVVINKQLCLPVRSLSGRMEVPDNGERSTVLPSPIPWRSRSGRVDARVETNAPSSKIEPLNLSNPPSASKQLALSPSLSPMLPPPSRSLSRENSEKKKNFYKEIKSLQPPAPPPPPPPHSLSRENLGKKKNFYKEIKSLKPPVPPPPPPPHFLGHLSYHTPFYEQRKKSSTARSFKDELKDVSMRTKPRPRIRLDNASSSSPSLMVNAKSVRTFRPKEIMQNEPPKTKTSAERRREEDIIERFTISSDSDKVSDSTDSEIEEVEEETEDYSDKEMIEKSKSGAVELEEMKNIKEEQIEEANEVDKKADEFIAKFREQIRLQRIESIKRSAGTRGVRSRKNY